MPELFEDVKEQPRIVDNPTESEIVGKLFKFWKPENNPWYQDYLRKLAKCYEYKELNQWSGDDMQKLATAEVPTISVDRINRGLDTIKGIRDNTNNTKKYVKRSLGDKRIADVFDKLAKNIEYASNFTEARDNAFDALVDCGMGIRKIGFDPTGNGGEGEFWCEYIPTENMRWSKCKRKDLADARWIIQHSVMDWEDAIAFAPEKAGVIKGLKTTLASDWEKAKTGNVPGTIDTRDYGAALKSIGSGNGAYPDQVDVYEFWIQRSIPRKKIAFMQMVPVPMPDGSMMPSMQPSIRVESAEYKLQQNEEAVASFVESFYEQIVVIGNESNGIIVKTGREDFHPFVGMCSETTKRGEPVGYIWKVIPHQDRVNVAWAQKVAYNNKSIKSPLIVKGSIDLNQAVQQSSFGAIFQLPHGASIESLNVQPQVNLQAIEEGQMARSDMDFAAAATEGSLRGQVSASTSGIALAQQQNASITPINKWVKAEKHSEVTFGRKFLQLLVKYLGTNPQKMARIIGEEEFMKISGPETDPITMQPIGPPLDWNAIAQDGIDISNYDVIVEDQSTSDLNKQQTFNAVLAMRQDGIVFTDDMVIKSAPVKNVDELIQSNERARQDVLKILMQQNAMLQSQLGMAMKQQKSEGSQRENAVKGKSAPQVKQTMVGGTSPNTVMGMSNPQ